MVLLRLKVNIWIMKAFRIQENINTLLQYYENVFMLDKRWLSLDVYVYGVLENF